MSTQLTEQNIVYTSVFPAGSGLLARQIVLRYFPEAENTRFVVHMRCWDDEGKHFHINGYYCNDFVDAIGNFVMRATREFKGHNENMFESEDQ